jgi:hypothetical protein
MSEALTKKPTLGELKEAARVLLEEDPSLTAAVIPYGCWRPKTSWMTRSVKAMLVQRHTSIIWWLGAVWMRSIYRPCKILGYCRSSWAFPCRRNTNSKRRLGSWIHSHGAISICSILKPLLRWSKCLDMV